MKYLTYVTVFLLAVICSSQLNAKQTNYDVTILPLLFYAEPQGYVANSPWFELNYQRQQVNLSTCATLACKQAIVFEHFKQPEPSEPARQQLLIGQPGHLKAAQTFSTLSLGRHLESQLVMSGNQRRVLFSLSLSQRLKQISFTFNDQMHSQVIENGQTLLRSIRGCKSPCSYRWQAFSIDREGQYRRANFSQDEAGTWLVTADDDAVKLELTSLIGEYKQSKLVDINDNQARYVQRLTGSSDQVDIINDNHQQRLQLTKTKVLTFVDELMLVNYKKQLMLIDDTGNIIVKNRKFNACSKRHIASRYIRNRLYIVCAIDKGPLVRASRVPILVQYPTEHLSSMQDLYIFELTPSFDVIAATKFDFPSAQINQLWIKPWRWGIRVGTGEANRATVYHSYQMNQSATNVATCPNIDDGYGYGLLCWKALNNPTLTYTPSAAAANIPTSVVDNTTPNLMNQLEDNLYGNIFTDAGVAVDPNGVWTHPNNAASSKQHLALATAMYHYRWGSPVAANIIYPIGSASKPVMFREVKYAAANTSNLPHNVCNEFSASSSYPEYQAADACMVQADFGLFSVDSLVFDRWVSGTYTPSATVSGSDLYWFPWYTNYVGDPPVTEVFAAEAVNEMSARLMPNAAQTGRLTQDTYVNGIRVSQAVVAGFYLMDY
ncbi:hypothetical protein [Shewanella marina]|uniref:hypothetical protein n=1 Tax=Shewanella marina TaxID=487319 RepID=UPI000A9A1F52|nr:hypothetical protein [Shewanella marina]